MKLNLNVFVYAPNLFYAFYVRNPNNEAQGCCIRHQVDCLYDRANRCEASRPDISKILDPAPRQIRTTAAQAAARSDVHTEELMPVMATESRDRRYLELQLLHMWTTEVCQTLPGSYDPQNLKIWSSDVPKLALDYEPLLTAIFSYSLLYMVFSNSQVSITEDELFEYRAEYFEATLRHHRKALGSMDHRTANAAGFTSIILIFDAFAALRERWIQSMRPNMPYKPPTEWLQMCRGVRNVVALGLDMVGEDPNASLNIMARGATDFINPEIVYSEANRARFAHLLSANGDKIDDDADNEAYTNAVAYIGSIAAANEAGEVPLKVARRLTIFPIILHSRFLALLDMLSPRAMVILAHYFALVYTLDGLWWVGNCPEKEIEAIMANLSSEWHGMMEWPLQVLRNRGQPSVMGSNKE
ncbi:zn2-c6 fungal-type dna-binding domain-containing [Trichoderma arundinaceum]|uniref:Zn2-c6 fungal-type dna-binding domain-containing n=1 Tax=Trichoderma arundinaceum TaxID=490622 RepID=A0A395NVW3_TRIAR|nr:zn2-c6 fungal-type dna-binding domain-containing [Trichoderma arundinaceum]